MSKAHTPHLDENGLPTLHGISHDDFVQLHNRPVQHFVSDDTTAPRGPSEGPGGLGDASGLEYSIGGMRTARGKQKMFLMEGDERVAKLFVDRATERGLVSRAAGQIYIDLSPVAAKTLFAECAAQLNVGSQNLLDLQLSREPIGFTDKLKNAVSLGLGGNGLRSEIYVVGAGSNEQLDAVRKETISLANQLHTAGVLASTKEQGNRILTSDNPLRLNAARCDGFTLADLKAGSWKAESYVEKVARAFALAVDKAALTDEGGTTLLASAADLKPDFGKELGTLGAVGRAAAVNITAFAVKTSSLAIGFERANYVLHKGKLQGDGTTLPNLARKIEGWATSASQYRTFRAEARDQLAGMVRCDFLTQAQSDKATEVLSGSMTLSQVREGMHPTRTADTTPEKSIETRTEATAIPQKYAGADALRDIARKPASHRSSPRAEPLQALAQSGDWKCLDAAGVRGLARDIFVEAKSLRAAAPSLKDAASRGDAARTGAALTVLAEGLRDMCKEPAAGLGFDMRLVVNDLVRPVALASDALRDAGLECVVRDLIDRFQAASGMEKKLDVDAFELSGKSCAAAGKALDTGRER